MGDRVADHADSADLVCQAVEQERAPDDVEQVEGEEDRFDLRPGEDLPGAAEKCQADDDGHDPTGGAGAHPSPFKGEHEDHDGQDGKEGEQPGQRCQFHIPAIIRLMGMNAGQECANWAMEHCAKNPEIKNHQFPRKRLTDGRILLTCFGAVAE